MNMYLRLISFVGLSLLGHSISAKNYEATELHEAAHRAGHIKLDNPYLARLDGVKYLVDGINIKEIILAQRDLATALQGKFDKETKKRIGTYVFCGKKVAIAHLAKIEQNGNLSSKEATELSALLKFVLEEIVLSLEPFTVQLTVARQFVIPIIEEWARKRNRTDSFMLRWSESYGKEQEMFLDEVTSFKDIYYFCKDIHTFLGDLINNCPKGYKQFLELVKQNEQQRCENQTE